MKQHEIRTLFAGLDVALLGVVSTIADGATDATDIADANRVRGVGLAMEAIHALEARMKDQTMTREDGCWR